MNFSTRDRRALVLLGAGLLTVLVVRFGVYRDSAAGVVESSDSIPLAEKRLARLRQAEVSGPAKQTLLNRIAADLALAKRAPSIKHSCNVREVVTIPLGL